MRFVETPIFTEVIGELLSVDEYARLQHNLILRPDLGVVIPGSRGIRKLRFGVAGQGKRGGLRVIYFWEQTPEVFFMLYAYRKSQQADLTPAQLRILTRVVGEELK